MATIPLFNTIVEFKDRESIIRALATFSMKGMYALDVLKSHDTLLAKCSSQPECRHRLIFRRLDNDRWRLTAVDVGHCHKKGKESRSLFLPASARVKRRKLDKDRDMVPTRLDPVVSSQRDRSILHDTRSDGHPYGDSGSLAGEIDSPAPNPTSTHPSPRQIPASLDVTTPTADQTTFHPSRVLLPPLEKSRRTVRPRASSSHREEGSASLIRLRDMYHGDGPDDLPELTLTQIKGDRVSIDDLAEDVQLSSKRRYDTTVPHLFGSTARPFLISDCTSTVPTPLILEKDAKYEEVQVWDVDADCPLVWPNHQWLKYWKDPKAGRATVLSAKVEHYRQKQEINVPKLVTDICWNHRATGKTSETCYMMTTADSYTGWHIDLHGLSTWAQPIYGEKLFCCAPPTEANMAAYQSWLVEEDADLTEQLDQVYYFVLHPGSTLMLPSGTIHCVYSPVKSLMVGGSYASDYDVVHQVVTLRRELILRPGTDVVYPGYLAQLCDYLERQCGGVTPSPSRVRLHLLPIVDALSAVRFLDTPPVGFPSKALIKRFLASIS